MNPPPASAANRFAGSLLMAIGAMIFLACGACTVGVIGASLPAVANTATDATTSRDYAKMFLILAPAVGGVPTLVGAGLAVFGLLTWRGSPRPTEGRVTLGGALMATGAVVAWVSAAIQFVVASSGAASSMVSDEPGAAVVTLAGSGAVWFGWKILRGPGISKT